MRLALLLPAALLTLGLGGCAGMNDTQQRTLTGGAGGAAGLRILPRYDVSETVPI